LEFNQITFLKVSDSIELWSSLATLLPHSSLFLESSLVFSLFVVVFLIAFHHPISITPPNRTMILSLNYLAFILIMFEVVITLDWQKERDF